ncbi:MAG TPA: YncE family protein, partial [Usitatibacter sp.]|nr:YncE family protein [Usitatibacter sp.]
MAKPSLIRIALALAVALAKPAIAAPFAYITETGHGNVRVIDTATNATVASIDAGLAPFGIAVNAAGTRVYVSDVLGDALL